MVKEYEPGQIDIFGNSIDNCGNKIRKIYKEQNINNHSHDKIVNDGGKKMEEKKIEQRVEEIVNWDEAMEDTGFVKFEEGKRKNIIITNCRVAKVEKPDFKDPEKLVKKNEFKADCLSDDGKQCQKQVSILSSRFLKGIGKLIMEAVSEESEIKSKTFSVDVKKIGSGTGTNYDFENFKVISSVVEEMVDVKS